VENATLPYYGCNNFFQKAVRSGKVSEPNRIKREKQIYGSKKIQREVEANWNTRHFLWWYVSQSARHKKRVRTV
jgi:hypothetical protein